MLKVINRSEVDKSRNVKHGKYNDTNTCDRCKKEKLEPTRSFKEYDTEGKWTGKWLCNKCYIHDYYIKDYKYRPDCSLNKFKRICDWRNGTLDPQSNRGKGFQFEELTKRWRGIKNLNEENDNFNSPLDHSIDSDVGIIQTKGAFFNPIEGFYQFNVKNEHGKGFDVLVCYCASADGETIERVYFIPYAEVQTRTNIAIVKNPSRKTWFAKYRIKDEDILKCVNEIWKEIRKEIKQRQNNVLGI